MAEAKARGAYKIILNGLINYPYWLLSRFNYSPIILLYYGAAM